MVVRSAIAFGKVPHNGPALRLQEIEVDLVTDRVLARPREERIPRLTVHDFVMCKKADKGCVYRVMKEELRELIGHECELHTRSSEYGG